MRAYCFDTKPIDFRVFCRSFKNQRHLELVQHPRDRVKSLIYLKMGEKAVISEERVAPLPLPFRQRLTGYMRAYCFYTKPIDFLVLFEFF